MHLGTSAGMHPLREKVGDLGIESDVDSPGRFLRHLREYRGWTRAELEEQTGGQVKERSIFNYETGNTTPQAATLLPLARVFGGGDGVELLERFGFHDDARMLAERNHRQAADRMRDFSSALERVLSEFERETTS